MGVLIGLDDVLMGLTNFDGINKLVHAMKVGFTMPFPMNQEALFSAGYEYLKWERCPVCTLDVEVWTAPGDYEIIMDPMPGLKSLTMRHCVSCKPTRKEELNGKNHA